ncbi:hypothetical protein J4460_02750 [Candidatus Woesearchaeota archaeon]|nr:MAG: hypothetical protein QS99_C0005G0049 [archaeon GW2011_AR4]MBS3129569.1 hypothetical protein [Candidatus Woesearchaeota archaeon]HIH37537.1 hypothetical protein [Candidatus Woesearchaeota archaeon]HIH49714.1 hypothetical protein [Candidatus Woesearchaeota archaeon]HIJ03208.1 hypothetical protein [Candidatus Woesearchaeota archaeon]
MYQERAATVSGNGFGNGLYRPEELSRLAGVVTKAGDPLACATVYLNSGRVGNVNHADVSRERRRGVLSQMVIHAQSKARQAAYQNLFGIDQYVTSGGPRLLPYSENLGRRLTEDDLVAANLEASKRASQDLGGLVEKIK